MIRTITQKDIREIGTRIKEMQNSAELTNHEMADLLCISEIQYLKIIRGVTMVTEDKFLVLNKELGVSLDYLFTGLERCRKLMDPEGGINTEVEFRIFLNEVSGYILGLPPQKKKERMIEFIQRFIQMYMFL